MAVLKAARVPDTCLCRLNAQRPRQLHTLQPCGEPAPCNVKGTRRGARRSDPRAEASAALVKAARGKDAPEAEDALKA